MQSTILKGLSLMFVAVVATTACSTEVPDALAQANKAQDAVLLVESSRNGGFSEFEGMANLEPINQSGIRARIEFLDDGTTLTVNGAATGLDPEESYVTLIYDNGSVPGGPNGCAPTIFDPSDPGFLLATMLIGFWDVDPEGNGTLFAINTNFGADYVPLDKFRNTSVRRVTGPPPAPRAPPSTELVSCGRVSTQPRP